MTSLCSVLRVLRVLRVLVVIIGYLASYTTAQDAQNTPFTLAAIASAAPQSNSFALVNDTKCDASVVTVVYELYTRNTMVFQTCVSDGKYNIFPFSGTHPTTQQIGAMSRSLACRAIFASILLAGIPECEISNFPMRAAAETLLKIAVDVDKYPKIADTVPSTERFVQMMQWRRDVNLAATAGVPNDSKSKLYAEYSSNLYTITTNGLVRLTADKEVQYRSTVDGSFSQDHIVSLPSMPALHGSDSAKVGSKIFAVVDSYECDNEVVKTVKTVATANRAMFNKCKADSGYQLYPYTGVLPDAKIITELIDSAECMGIITAVVLLNMPPCIIDSLPMRASCETLLYFSTIIGNGASAPTAAQYDELMAWRSDSDLAKAAGAPFDGDSDTYSTFTKNLRAALIASKVTVMNNYTIILGDSEGTSIEMKDGEHPSFVSTNSSMDFFVGKVIPAGEESVSEPAETTTAELVTTRTSDTTVASITSTTLAIVLAIVATNI
ncbi:hypothetical protein BBO99_00006892 [Phytophthora kernoviae]|uniref:Elicitin n=1 Tax=Phytophthora kernoviae TaxID=325452 RepID=A0A3R7GR71_9STRA|nr:hypothetical protein JM16_006532 [Phytophthora kernoviae]RLN32043.1 hypothetical protein BBI17_006918 [Phytophthora kernoviae]RLN77253.1 hypothetical protein BBO99_00006892 [Phytophthora kernoviae]